MNKTVFLLGHSDIAGQESSTRQRVSGGTRVTAEVVGVLPILPWLQRDKTLAANSTSMVVTEETPMPGPDPRLNLFNLVGDPDSSPNGLHRLQKVVNSVRPKRCFNYPANVFRTSRARLPATLADIPGCIVPNARSADPRSADELKSACAEFNCWPLILRARGYHGGENMVMLRELSDIEGVKDQQWLYAGIFLIEFVDYKGDDGLYQKTRMVMINGTPLLRHSIYHDDWAIHSGARSSLMNGDMDLCRREARFLAEFKHDGMKKHAPVFQAIGERVGLDVFGIDFALLNGEILVFEANACMSFVGERHGTDEQYGYLDDYLTAIRRALKKMLLKG
jgi:hypothetical protein